MTMVTSSALRSAVTAQGTQAITSSAALVAKHTDASGRLDTKSAAHHIAEVAKDNPEQGKQLYNDVRSELEKHGHPLDIRHLENDVRSALAEAGEGGFGTEDAISLGLDVLPVVGTAKGVVELVMGQDPITGDKIPRWESAIGLAASLIPGGKAAIGGGMDVARTVAKYDDEVLGVVGKGGGLDEIGDVVPDKTLNSMNSSNLGMSVEKATPELIESVSQKRQVVFAKEGSEDLAYLDFIGAEANVGGADYSHILLRENPGKAAVLEEFLHGTQSKLGIIDELGTSGLGSAETHVKDFMIRHRKMLGIGDEDIKILQQLRDAGL